MRYKVERPSIGVTSKCSLYEHEQFEKLCKKYGVTMYKGINLLIRLAITKGALPISYDYENKDHLKKEPIPEMVHKEIPGIEKEYNHEKYDPPDINFLRKEVKSPLKRYL